MISPERQVASEVNELLLEARPQSDDANLRRAEEITSSPDVIAHDDFRADVFLAIQRLQKAIDGIWDLCQETPYARSVIDCPYVYYSIVIIR